MRVRVAPDTSVHAAVQFDPSGMAAAGHIEISHMCCQLSVWHKSAGVMRARPGALLPIDDLWLWNIQLCASRGSIPLSLIINWEFELQTDRGWFDCEGGEHQGFCQGDAPHGSGPACVAGKSKARRGGAQMPSMNGRISPRSRKKDWTWITMLLHCHYPRNTGLNKASCPVLLWATEIPHGYSASGMNSYMYNPVTPTQGATSRVFEEGVGGAGLCVMVTDPTHVDGVKCGARVLDTWQPSVYQWTDVGHVAPAELCRLSATRGQQSLPPEFEPLHSRRIGANPGTTGHENLWPADLCLPKTVYKNADTSGLGFFLKKLCKTQT